jgi:hypothetical protein
MIFGRTQRVRLHVIYLQYGLFCWAHPEYIVSGSSLVIHRKNGPVEVSVLVLAF